MHEILNFWCLFLETNSPKYRKSMSKNPIPCGKTMDMQQNIENIFWTILLVGAFCEAKIARLLHWLFSPDIRPHTERYCFYRNYQGQVRPEETQCKCLLSFFLFWRNLQNRTRLKGLPFRYFSALWNFFFVSKIFYCLQMVPSWSFVITCNKMNVEKSESPPSLIFRHYQTVSKFWSDIRFCQYISNNLFHYFPNFGGRGSKIMRNILIFDVISELYCVSLRRRRRIKKHWCMSQHATSELLECFPSTKSTLWVIRNFSESFIKF